jgi:hypothetical protein
MQNATGRDSASGELSFWGRCQAKDMVKRWANVHIDHLYSSTLKRALDTAHEIAKYNKRTLEIEARQQLVERYLGTTVDQYAREDNNDAVFKEAMGFARGSRGIVNRDYRPSGGGESFSDVARRGRQFVEKEILGRCAIPLARSLESFADIKRTFSVKMSPELGDIPHMVIVSHNAFLTEMYEGIRCWNEDRPDSGVEWQNADW